MKKKDWLKPIARKVVAAVETGRLKETRASATVLHEMYYVFSEHASLDTILADFGRVVTIKNLRFLSPDTDVYLSALHLSRTYGVTSMFDAVYAATALSSAVPDHKILSTDSVYDRIPGLKRVSPEGLDF